MRNGFEFCEQCLPMMKYADLQPPVPDLLAGQPLWSMVSATVPLTNGVSELPSMS